MSGGRPSRGAKVRYREVDSDESDFEYDEFTKVVTVEPYEDNSGDEDYKPGDNLAIPDATPKVVYPPLSELQLRLRKVCRLGDENLLRTFLADNPGVDLDVKDPDGGTILTETATKTAQFCDIAYVLIEAGAGLEVSDSLGNTPLHNAVLYFPSTQRTVDLLLQHGANVTSKNHEGYMPEGLAEDKDLKLVLKELRKAAGRKKCASTSVSLYLNSPELRKKIYDKVLVEERFKQEIKIKYNAPPTVNSPGLLKRKRKIECLDTSLNERQSKRIRWNEVDSAGREIDPQFSSEEDCGASQDEDVETQVYQDTSGTKIDEEEDVIIVHDDVKNNTSLDSDTELCLRKPNRNEEREESYGEEDIETCFIPESITFDTSREDSITQVSSKEKRDELEQDQDHLELEEEEAAANVTDSSIDVGKETQDEVVNGNNNVQSPGGRTDKSDPAGTFSNPTHNNISDCHDKGEAIFSGSKNTQEERVDGETNNIIDEDYSVNESGEINPEDAGQFVRKCSQGFGFFVS